MSPDSRPHVAVYSDNYLGHGGKLNAYTRAIGIASKIANLRGGCGVEEFVPSSMNPDRYYFIPIYPLVAPQAEKLGIRGPEDFYGGVLPVTYMTGKGVTHGLVRGDSTKPTGWVEEFPHAISSTVLPGFTVFSEGDAVVAAKKLAQEGLTPRGKRAAATSGYDQYIIRNEKDLERALGDISHDELKRDGYVIEANLENPITLIIGQAEIDGMFVSYYGKQRSTKDTKGKEYAFGGSDLFMVQGKLRDLQEQIKGKNLPYAELAIEQVIKFDDHAMNSLGMFGSRRTYDVIQGSSSGDFYSGVTDPSWRLGGSSASEILALQAFRKNPNLKVVIGSTNNIFYDRRASRSSRYYYQTLDKNLRLPEDAFISFQGQDTPYSDNLLCYTTCQEVGKIFSLDPFRYTYSVPDGEKAIINTSIFP